MKKSLFFVVLLPVFACCLSVAFSLPAFAADQVDYLDEIVVTATKIEEPLKDVPASVQVITSEDIKNSTALNAGDLIAEASIGHVHKYTGALTSRIGLRGLTTDLLNDLNSRVLILVNSHRAGTVNLAKIPADEIERIEIVKGPGSVLYGSSAMGGVINIITKKRGEEGRHASLSAEAGSWGFWKTTADLGLRQGPFDLFLSAGSSSIDDYEANGFGLVENSGFSDATLTAGLGISLPDEQRLSLGFQAWKGWDIGDPGPRYAPDPDNFSDKERTGFDLGYERGTFSAGYYFISDRDEAHGGMTKGPGNSVITTKKTVTQGATLQKSISIGEHRIIVGGQWDRVEARSWKNTAAPSTPDSQYDTYDGFAEGRLSLLDSRLLLSAGLRYDWFENSILATPGLAVNPREEALDHLTARGGVVYKVTDRLRLKGNIGSAFRAPAPNELAIDHTTWSTRYIGNPDLKPEKSTTCDAGVEYGDPLLKAGLTFFHTEFEDKILGYYDSGLAAMTWKNVDGATLQGVELNASYDIGLALGLEVSIEPFTNITYLTRFSSRDELEINKYGKTLLYTPKWTGAFGIRAGQEKWDARVIANYTGDELVQDWSASPYPVVKKGDFTVVSLKGSYRPMNNLEITASVENLLDRAYSYILGYPMQGRTIVAGLKWKF
ncbi:MAG: TonB-dependent receptor [Thermodesulfovibrionales bacterium]